MPGGIDYGVVSRTFQQYIVRLDVCEHGEEVDSLDWWLGVLSDETRTDDEILEEVWRGKGNLWVYTRPDRFPIDQCFGGPYLTQFFEQSNARAASGGKITRFDAIPHDILFLICELLPLRTFLNVLSLNKRIRTPILSRANELAYKAMKNVAPWNFPAHPIKTPDGTREREELDWWEREWKVSGGLEPGEIRGKAPWMKYWIECSRSRNIRNRRRIWGIAEQMDGLAEF